MRMIVFTITCKTICIDLSVQPLLPPHLRSNQSDSQASKSDSSNELVASGNSQEHTE